MTVRVRIAPSPTGEPHVGTAYIGLLNWCFARRHGGKFILRIEDTDQTRCTQASADAIYASLKWLGLNYDEGPDVGGDRGPYVQSERVQLGIYREQADRLLANGSAYRCFCTAERLDGVRKAQLAAKQPVMYDRHCRGMSAEESERRAAVGEPHVVRMCTPTEGAFSYPDRLRKKPFSKQWAEIDDQVLLKSDGWPTYHLAAVVDDHLMGITHVIRAEEWLNSLPKHILLNQLLGFTPPEYVHVGLLRNADKSKISKRKNPTSLLWYRRQGYLPEALLNFLALLGHSHPDGKEQFAIAEMAQFFDLDRINVAGPVFDLAKLDHLQGLYFRALPEERIRAAIHDAVDVRFGELLPLYRERMTRGGDFLAQVEPFYTTAIAHRREDLVPKDVEPAAAKAVLEELHKLFRNHLAEDQPWTAAALEAAIKDAIAAHAEPPVPAWSQKSLFGLLRVAATGRTATPPLFETLAAIGHTRVIERVAAAAAKLK